MPEQEINITDESGDKKYFTLVPNYILNHSSANDQSLYLQMKRRAGENGKCIASKNTLMGKMGIGEKQFNKSLSYLIGHKWIEFLGYEMTITAGGPQKIKAYKINDIWKQNIEFYKGGVESTHLSKVVSKVSKGGVESTSKVVSKVTPNKNIEQIRTNTIENYTSLQDLEMGVGLEQIAETYQVTLSFVKSKLDDLKNYCQSTGKKYKDYRSTLRHWVKSDALKLRKEDNGRSKITIISEDPAWKTG